MESENPPFQPEKPENKGEKPPRLPTQIEFMYRLLRMRKTEGNEDLPPVPENPTASDVAEYGRVDWDHLKGIKVGHRHAKNQTMAHYLHDLARLMMTREGYTGRDAGGQKATLPSMNILEEQEYKWIGLDDDWRSSDEGRHRFLVLKLLGKEFIEKSGMNDWVKIRRYPSGVS